MIREASWVRWAISEALKVGGDCVCNVVFPSLTFSLSLWILRSPLPLELLYSIQVYKHLNHSLVGGLLGSFLVSNVTILQSTFSSMSACARVQPRPGIAGCRV